MTIGPDRACVGRYMRVKKPCRNSESLAMLAFPTASQLGPGRYRSPYHPMYFEPSCFLRRGGIFIHGILSSCDVARNIHATEIVKRPCRSGCS